MSNSSRAARWYRHGCALVFAVPLLGVAVEAAAAPGKRHELSAAEIKTTFIGKIATDGTHWTYFIKPDGSINAIEMGRQRKGHWAIRGNELCLSVPVRAPEDCWTVVRQQGKLIFHRDGMDAVDVTVEAPSAEYRLE